MDLKSKGCSHGVSWKTTQKEMWDEVKSPIACQVGWLIIPPGNLPLYYILIPPPPPSPKLLSFHFSKSKTLRTNNSSKKWATVSDTNLPCSGPARTGALWRRPPTFLATPIMKSPRTRPWKGIKTLFLKKTQASLLLLLLLLLPPRLRQRWRWRSQRSSWRSCWVRWTYRGSRCTRSSNTSWTSVIGSRPNNAPGGLPSRAFRRSIDGCGDGEHESGGLEVVENPSPRRPFFVLVFVFHVLCIILFSLYIEKKNRAINFMKPSGFWEIIVKNK